MIKAKRTVWLAFTVLWGVASILAYRSIRLDLVWAISSGFGYAILHWFAFFVPHFGHAHAARPPGHPMIGILLWWALATSLYPREEPDLPASTHIRRALGGPLASLGFGAVIGLLAWALQAQGYASWTFMAFLAFDSFVVFGLGSLVPLGFNDGSTLIRWVRARRDD